MSNTNNEQQVVQGEQKEQKVALKRPIRTKLFSLLLLALLIIPALIFTPSRGTVLGISEEVGSNPKPTVNTESTAVNPETAPRVEKAQVVDNNQKIDRGNTFEMSNFFGQKETVAPTPKESSIGEIGSGAVDVRTLQDEDSNPIITGKVVWDENAKTSTATDKFNLGSGIVVSLGDKNTNLVVGDNRVLSADTVLVVNRETFEKIGGNPDEQDSIEISARLD